MNSLKELLEQAKTASPLQVGSEHDQGSNIPSIPYKGLSLVITKNLLENTIYICGIINPSSGARLNESVRQVLMMLNNITEILAFLIFKQGPESIEGIESILEQNLQKTIELLEQNRLSIKKDLENIQQLNNENYKTVSIQLDRISNLILENNSKELERSIKDLREEVKKISSLPEKIEKLEQTLENLDNKL